MNALDNVDASESHGATFFWFTSFEGVNTFVSTLPILGSLKENNIFRKICGQALHLLPPSITRIWNNGSEREHTSCLSLSHGIVRVGA